MAKRRPKTPPELPQPSGGTSAGPETPMPTGSGMLGSRDRIPGDIADPGAGADPEAAERRRFERTVKQKS